MPVSDDADVVKREIRLSVFVVSISLFGNADFSCLTVDPEQEVVEDGGVADCFFPSVGISLFMFCQNVYDRL
jgi:hypothetical protein